MNKKSDTIMIISGDSACFNALNEFAEAFSTELNSAGYKTEIIEINTLTTAILNDIITSDYRAIVGFQTNLFTLKLPDNRMVGELLPMPKYNFIFDSPATKMSYFSYDDPTMNLLLSDDGYIDFVHALFPGRKHVHFLPPGGGIPTFPQTDPDYSNRIYDLTFMGTYNNYRKILQSVVDSQSNLSGLILDFFQYMIERPNKSAEESIMDFLSEKDIHPNQAVFLQLYECFFSATMAVLSYYRESVIKYLLSNGVKVDVFSESWQESPFANDPNLCIHNGVSYRDTFHFYEQSKISLNVFSWHKGMMSERIANIMLGGALCASDYSSRLNSMFHNKEDILLFDLSHLSSFSESVIDLLNNDTQRLSIAKAGYNNACKNHLWKNRVLDFIKILEKDALPD